MGVTGSILDRLATHAIDSTLANVGASAMTPLDRARERLARAQSAANMLDTIENQGILASALAGGAVAVARRR
jgi:hypothetical protein